MEIRKFTMAAAVAAMALAGQAAQAEDRVLIDCVAAGVTPPSALGSHSLGVWVPDDLPLTSGWSGSVVLALTIDRDGSPRDVQLDRSSGVVPVDDAVTEIARDHWRYAPATQNGKPIACRARSPILWGRRPPTPAPSKPSYTVLHMQISDYPAAILAKKEEGTVGLTVFIDDDDQKTVTAKVVNSSGFPDLDSASVDFVTHHAHLEPAQVNGGAVRSAVYVGLQWSIAPPGKPSNAKIANMPAQTSEILISELWPPCTLHMLDNSSGEFSRRGAILLEHDGVTANPAQLDGIKLLAGDLANAIEAGASGVQIRAYGGDSWDVSSAACKLSMERGLAIRQLLVDNGVKENQISVLAMGGNAGELEPDRVDLYVQTK